MVIGLDVNGSVLITVRNNKHSELTHSEKREKNLHILLRTFKICNMPFFAILGTYKKLYNFGTVNS